MHPTQHADPALYLIRRGRRWGLVFGAAQPEGDVRASWRLSPASADAVGAVGSYDRIVDVEAALARFGLCL